MSKTQIAFKESEWWFRLAVCVNVHIKKALLDILHNRNNLPGFRTIASDPEKLYEFLLNNKNKFKNSKVLKSDQLLALLPPNKYVDSSNLDVTLIRFLIRTFNAQHNWSEPDVSDDSIAAFVYRAAGLRNEVFHFHNIQALDRPKFEEIWTRMKHVLNGLKYHEDIEPMRTEDLDPSRCQEALKEAPSFAFIGVQYKPQRIERDATQLLLDDIVDDAKNILVCELKHSERKELERPLEHIIPKIDIPVWEKLCYKLVDAKLIHLSENAIKLIKYPNCRKIGKYIFDALKVIRPKLTVKELKSVALKNNRSDICDFLESYDENHLIVKINMKDKTELCILCSIPVQNGANWTALAEDLGLDKTQRARIANSTFVSVYEQVMDMFNSFEYSNPQLNLYDLLCPLQELHAIDAVQTLITIIRERTKENVSLHLPEDL